MSDGDGGAGDVGADGGHGGHDDSSAGLEVGIVAGILAAEDAAKYAPARKAEPYVEPDYEVVWARRWRVIKPVLVVLLVAGVALLTWASVGSNP